MTKDQLYDKMRSNVEEIRARQAPIVVLTATGDESARELGTDVMYVQKQWNFSTTPQYYSHAIVAYHIAVALKRDVDRPRNLAKSVTVE